MERSVTDSQDSGGSVGVGWKGSTLPHSTAMRANVCDFLKFIEELAEVHVF